MNNKNKTMNLSNDKKYEIQKMRLKQILGFRKKIISWGDYDHSLSGAIGEIYSQAYLGMKKAKKGEAGYDGVIKKNKIQVKTKDGSIDNKSQVYFQISEKDFDSFDEFLGIRILTRDRNKGIINKLEIRHIGPIPKDVLMQKVRGKRYFLNDIMDLGYEEIIGYIEK